VDPEEWNFFLKGADITAERKIQPPNAVPDWVSQNSWNCICDLDKMANFAGLVGAFTHNSKEWKRWYMSSTPETDPLPGEWDTKCDHLRKMIIIKTIRPDRVLFSASLFIKEKLGENYVTSQTFSLESVYSDSSKLMPVIFILSPGVNPMDQLD